MVMNHLDNRLGTAVISGQSPSTARDRRHLRQVTKEIAAASTCHRCLMKTPIVERRLSPMVVCALFLSLLGTMQALPRLPHMVLRCLLNPLLARRRGQAQAWAVARLHNTFHV